MRWMVHGMTIVAAALMFRPALAQQESVAIEGASVTDGAVHAQDFLAPFRDKAEKRWEKEIQKIEAKDAAEDDPSDAILFIGSSSIRRWSDIAIDMAPFSTIQRGYGGAKYSDVAIFASRLLNSHQYRALVIFVGNDVSGSPEDHTPDQVEQLARHVIGVSKAHQPDAPVYLIEVTPTGKRYEAWPKIRKVNERLREIALSTPHVYFIATAEHYLDPLGRPRDELFVEDRLHLNEAGYDLWSTLIRRKLEETLRAAAEFHARPPSDESSQPTADSAVSR